jgi:hypothetical protein
LYELSDKRFAALRDAFFFLFFTFLQPQSETSNEDPDRSLLRCHDSHYKALIEDPRLQSFTKQQVEARRMNK